MDAARSNVRRVANSSDLPALSCLVAAWIALGVAVSPIGDFALNDDWVYGLTVRSILETGRFSLPSPSSANVFAQAYWGALFCLPFGFSFTALRISTLVLGGAGILALHQLLRELGARRPAALIGGLTMALNPLYLGMAASFMTDVPFTALVTVSLWLYVRGGVRDSRTGIIAAYAVAFVALLVRQFSLVLILAFSIADLARKRPGAFGRVMAPVPLVSAVALQLAYQYWLNATGRTSLVPAPLLDMLPRAVPQLAEVVGFFHYVFAIGGACAPYIGLSMAPVAVYHIMNRVGIEPEIRGRRIFSPRLIAAVTAGGAILLGAGKRWMPRLGNVVTTFGLGPPTLRDVYLLNLNRPSETIILKLFWIAANAAGTWGASLVMLAVAAAWMKSPAGRRVAWPLGLMVTFVLGYSVCVVLVGVKTALFDRYLITLIPPLCAIFVLATGHGQPAPASRDRLLPSALVLALFGVLSVLVTHDYLAWNRARWQATGSLMANGTEPRQIDGGYEFNGWYLYKSGYTVTPDKSYWWVDDDQYIITFGPIGERYAEAGRIKVHRWLPVTPANILIMQRTNP